MPDDEDWELLPSALRAALDAEVEAGDEKLVATLRDAREELVAAPLREVDREVDAAEVAAVETQDNEPVAFYLDDDDEGDEEYAARLAAATEVVESLLESLLPASEQPPDGPQDPPDAGDEPVDFDAIAGLMRAAARRVLRGVAAAVPQDDFAAFAVRLGGLRFDEDGEEQDRETRRDARLSYVVSLVVALAELVRADAAVATHLSERFPADLWLFYAQWMLVVYKISGVFPWFGDPETQGFWLALGTVAPSTVAQTRLLNTLETLVAKELGETTEVAADEEEHADEDEDDDRSVPSLDIFSLHQLAELLNFMDASSMPASLRDLPRLSRQATRRALLMSICGANPVVREFAAPDGAATKSDQVRRLRVKLAVGLYYIEQLELMHGLEPSWGTKVITEWAHEFHRCLGSTADAVKADDALSRMLKTLRQLFQIPGRDVADARDRVGSIDPIRGPIQAPWVERSTQDLSLADVLAHLSKLVGDHLDRAMLSAVSQAAQSVLDARERSDPTLTCAASYLEELVLLDRAFHRVTGYRHWLYPVQLVAIVCGTIALAETDQRLQPAGLATVLQMETGEGKSITFAVLAAFYARRGKRVDIATSNEQLAVDGAAGACALFADLGITCGVASGADAPASPASGSEKSYECQVVYSRISSLAGDYLREVIFQDRGRGKRAFDVLLVDEVDATLVDNVANVTMLSTPVAGMDKLFFLYGAVYDRVRRIVEAEGSDANVADQSHDDLRAQLGLPLREPPGDVDGEATGGGAEESQRAEPPPQVLPKEFLSLCDKKLAVYMDQCWMAQARMTSGREYDVIDGKVVVIDNRTSGEYQANSVYGDGLHQFLQRKHACELTAETLNSIFISNGAFARKYAHFVGLTGTLGDKADQNAIVKALVASDDEVHSNPSAGDCVRFVFLPRSKWRPFVEFPPLVFDEPSLAFEYCVDEIRWCQNANRPVLLVCQDKASALNLVEQLAASPRLCLEQKASSVKLYIINDPDLQTFSVIKDRLGPGDVVVSTTYGGRGTDYKLDADAETNGGLHTVLLFQTASRRQRDQIFGRSARAGVPGSGVLITSSRFLLTAPTDFASRRVEFDEYSAAQYQDSLADQLKSNMPLNEGCDQLFCRFVDTYTRVQAAIKRATAQSQSLRWYLSEAVRNRFGLFMEELKFQIADDRQPGAALETTSTPSERMLVAYAEWERQILKDVESGDGVITNPRAMVVYAKQIARGAASKKRGFSWDNVDRMVKRAIESDKFMAGPPAHFLRLQAMLTSKKRNARAKSDYDDVKAALNDALESIKYEVEFYMAVSGLMSDGKTSATALQITRVVDILMTMHSSVEEALAVVENAYKKKDENDSDKFFLTISLDHLPNDMDDSVLVTYRDMCDTGGHVGLIRLEEDRAWSWDWNAFGCLLLGVVQVIGGSVLMLLSAGSIGVGLIAEGVADFVASVVAVIKGDGSFSWTEYFTNKLIGLAMSVVCAGVCKIGKSLWNAGKALVKNGLTLAKSGWKRMLQWAANGARKMVTRARKIAAKVATVVRTPAKQALKKGMMQCGNKLGRELVKQVAINVVNRGVDAAIQEAFNAMQKGIDDRVKRSVQAWVERNEVTLAKFCRLGGHDAYRTLVDRGRARMSHPQSQVHALLRRFGDELAGTICSQLNEHSQKGGSNRHAVIATSIRVLVESAKWVEVLAEVTTFVEALLAVVLAECEQELRHICCAEMKKSVVITDAQRDMMIQLSIETHDAGDDNVHVCCTRSHSNDDLAQLNDNAAVLSAARNAQRAFADAVAFDKAAVSGKVSSWDPQRSLLVRALVVDAARFIRDKLEGRSADTSRKMASYGVGKLVEKLAQGYIVRKSKKLSEYKPSDDVDAAAHDKRVQKFMGDLEVQKMVAHQIGATEDSMSTIAHANALAEACDVCIVIHDEKGDQIVLNPTADGERVHLQSMPSGGDKRAQHLRPLRDPSGSYVDDPDGCDCLYRAVFFATSATNASSDDVSDLRGQAIGRFLASPQLQVLLFANQKPRTMYGGKDKGKTKAKTKAKATATDGDAPTDLTKPAKLYKVDDKNVKRHLFDEIVAKWKDVDQGQVLLGGDLKECVNGLNTSWKKRFNQNSNQRTFVRIERQKAMEGYHNYQVQIGECSHACVLIPKDGVFSAQEVQAAFHRSHDKQINVKLEVTEHNRRRGL